MFESEEIYTNWSANETLIYKLQLVYATRKVAKLPNVNPSVTDKVELDYTISEKNMRRIMEKCPNIDTTFPDTGFW